MQAELAPMQDEEDVKRPREENGHANGHAQVQHRASIENYLTQDCQIQLHQLVVHCQASAVHMHTKHSACSRFSILLGHIQGTNVPHKHLSAEGSSPVKSPVCLWHLSLMYTSLCILFCSITVCA